MRPFVLLPAQDAAGAVRASQILPTRGAEPRVMPALSDAAVNGPVNALANASAQFIAGGTTMLDLMKLDVMRPELLVDINPLTRTLGAIEVSAAGLRLGALVRMTEAAEHPVVLRDYPVIAESLNLAASMQLRNMASLAGNLLQRTRCAYFRDTREQQCNKRLPGSGCAALAGVNRQHAVLGGSAQCIATYPGDFAQALIALDATVDVQNRKGLRSIPVVALHRQPGDTPQIETVLASDDLITAIRVPAGPHTARSRYVKIRDRESYQFALASVAVALDMDGNLVRDVRIALGGVATVPWRARAAEALLKGRPLDEAAAVAAADAAFTEARAHEHNAYKIALGKRTVVRALLETAALPSSPQATPASRA